MIMIAEALEAVKVKRAYRLTEQGLPACTRRTASTHTVFLAVTTAQSTGERTSHRVPCLGGCVLSPALSSFHEWEPFILKKYIYFFNAFYERLSDEVVDIGVHDANGCHQRFFRTIPPIKHIVFVIFWKRLSVNKTHSKLKTTELEGC